jgi:hypothetical protein
MVPRVALVRELLGFNRRFADQSLVITGVPVYACPHATMMWKAVVVPLSAGTSCDATWPEDALTGCVLWPRLSPTQGSRRCDPAPHV